MNLVMLTGRLGKDPVLRQTKSEKSVVSFTMATTERPGAENSKTSWHSVVAWEKLAEICNTILSKGDLVTIVGRIEYSEYEVDGVKKYKTEIVAERMEKLSKSGENAKTEAPAEPMAATGVEPELPF